MGYRAGVLFVFFCILYLKGRDQKEEKHSGFYGSNPGEQESHTRLALRGHITCGKMKAAQTRRKIIKSTTVVLRTAEK